MDFHNFHTIYVLKVKESTADILTELPCLSDLENPSQLPIWKVLMILSYELLKFSDYSCFRGQGIHCWYFYRATLFELPRKSGPTSGSRVPQRYWFILSDGFSQFLHYLCFRGQEIHSWHSYWATMFEWPRKSKSTSGLRSTDDFVLWIFEIFTLFVFQRIHCWYFYRATMFG